MRFFQSSNSKAMMSAALATAVLSLSFVSSMAQDVSEAALKASSTGSSEYDSDNLSGAEIVAFLIVAGICCCISACSAASARENARRGDVVGAAVDTYVAMEAGQAAVNLLGTVIEGHHHHHDRHHHHGRRP